MKTYIKEITTSQPLIGVELWYVDLLFSELDLKSAWDLLNTAEQGRASRFVLPHLRNRFVAAHGTLRRQLGAALDMKPETVRFRYGHSGKPALAEDQASSGISFNLSHSGDGALLAIARGRELGVDIEYIRSTVDTDLLAERFFAPVERAWLMGTPSEARLEAFYQCWTAKEAYIKARGDGLGFPLQNFEALPRRDSGLLRLVVYGDAAETARWSLSRIPLPVGWVGALVIEAH